MCRKEHRQNSLLNGDYAFTWQMATVFHLSRFNGLIFTRYIPVRHSVLRANYKPVLKMPHNLSYFTTSE